MAITLQKFITNLQQVKKDLPEICRTLLVEGSKDFIKENVSAWSRSQLPSGEQLTNKFTGSTNYSLSWAATRKEKGLSYDKYTLQFTGELAKSIIFNIKLEKGKITGDIIPQSFVKNKATDMENMFGEIFGISKENLTIFTSWFKKELVKEIKKRLFAP